MTPKFTKTLLEWNSLSNDRPMPWKGEKDPYKIWLSEIILQQTRVDQGWAYYERFVKKYPTIFDLAATKDEQVFKLWEGLGYYNRCKNLLATARYIVRHLNGVFPNTYEKLIDLKGIGPYTASAIASFAFNLPYAVLDGNVYRVFARYYGIHTPTDTKEGLQLFSKMATDNLSKSFPGLYNQALMDFGATICKPMAPLCARCVMQHQCVAFAQNLVNQLPVKIKTITKKKRFFDFYCFQFEDKWLVQKRGEGDIWNGLYQFYLLEQDSQQSIKNTHPIEVLKEQLGIAQKCIVPQEQVIFAGYQQTLTHQLIQARFVMIQLKKIPSVFSKALWVNKKQIKKLPFPKILNDFLQRDFSKNG